jgi:hypothetical protein
MGLEEGEQQGRLGVMRMVLDLHLRNNGMGSAQEQRFRSGPGQERQVRDEVK